METKFFNEFEPIQVSVVVNTEYEDIAAGFVY